MKQLLRPFFSFLVLCAFSVQTSFAADKPTVKRPPNIVIIFIDDMGYADIGAFGAKDYATPNIDRMAKEGRKFTDFYVAQPVCGASRAALLTGCYPNRVGILGAPGPHAKIGLKQSEVTIAELLKQKNYATAIYGKWHLGHLKPFLPLQHGFDHYYGLPYSNDMWPFHPTAGERFPNLPLIEGNKTINENVTGKDQKQLTTDYTKRAVKFIEKNKEQPFFLYVPHTMVHVPLYVSDRFKGKSGKGLFADVMMEVDWSVGQILDTLRKHNLEKNTLVIFTADNGPWLSYGNHAGSAKPLREGKGTTWDGGVRESCLMWWPGTIPAGTVCKEPAMTIDILPTVATITGTELPKHNIDGKDIWPLVAGKKGAKSPQEAYYFYRGKELQAIRAGRWKMHFPHAYRTLEGSAPGSDGIPGRYEQGRTELALFDLKNDMAEQNNVIDKHPNVVERLIKLANKMRSDLGDSATKTKGKGIRGPGRL